MSNDLTKRTDPTKPEQQKSNDAASRLKRELMGGGFPAEEFVAKRSK